MGLESSGKYGTERLHYRMVPTSREIPNIHGLSP
ncbi:hypothetical protein ABID08_000535 [Rhizobium binae]|uniref:Uncharacterized protein n=1 Tax=Rhizobium binae TaxID=1138190 RepID=A0ABV2M9Q3_9HYPH